MLFSHPSLFTQLLVASNFSLSSCLNICHAMDLKSVFTQGVSWPRGTTIAYPNHESFVEATERWTVYQPPSYAVAITPSDEAAVVQAVKLAVAHNVPLLATGGRHGYTTTLGKLQHGLAIDLSKLKTIDVNTTAATLAVGGGVTFAEILDPLYQAGFEIKTGFCSCVGVVGATLGAGVGRYQGIHGLIIDALLSILNADFIFPGSATSAYFETLKSFGTLPAELVPVQGFFWDEGSNSTILIANWQYIGPEKKGRELMAPVLALNPIVQNITIVPWNQIIRVQGFGTDASLCIPNKNLLSYTLNVEQLSVPSFEQSYQDFSEFFAKYPGGRNSSALFETFPNTAVVALPVDSTSYPWRSAVGNYLFQFVFDKADHETRAAAEALGLKVRAEFVATSGYNGLAVYNNYAGGEESLEEVYSVENLPRTSSDTKTRSQHNIQTTSQSSILRGFSLPNDQMVCPDISYLCGFTR
ncbi:Glucooligosaccharide oxidase [Xylaria scruposa]|nr:Glucooligosaccharide oxidase [Xylaria scruposa]